MSGFGGDQEGKAQQYIADGEKVLKKWTLFSSTTKNEDAAECFDKAARCYKVSYLRGGWSVDSSPSLCPLFAHRELQEAVAFGVLCSRGDVFAPPRLLSARVSEYNSEWCSPAVCR